MREKKMPPLPFIHECFELDASCPSGLRWRERPLHHFKKPRSQKHFNNSFAGKPAGTLRAPGNSTQHYWIVRFGVGLFYAHRVVWAMHAGADPGHVVVDHIDGNTSNNAPANLRTCTASENQANRLAIKGKSFKGTLLHKPSGLWQAKIVKSLGYYKTEEEAAMAYQAAAEILQREFAVHMSRPKHTIKANASPLELIQELLKGTGD